MDFDAWLDREEFGTDEYPLDDETINLMREAWEAGHRRGTAMGDRRVPRWDVKPVFENMLQERVDRWRRQGLVLADGSLFA